MRRLLNALTHGIKRWTALGQSRADVKPTVAIQREAHPEPHAWWSGLSWKTDNNEEFTKWWNHWMSRIPHGQPVITTTRYGKKDV